MILVCGIPSESPLRMVVARLEAMDADFVLLNQREALHCDLWFEIDMGHVRGELCLSGRTYDLENFTAVYPRLMDDRVLPELAGEPADSPLRTRCRAFHDTLMRWMEIAPACVINRCAPMATNSSKPYQAQLISRLGFRIPETLISNDPDRVRAFRAEHGRIIYKSISAVRSIVRELADKDEERLELIRWCPTQFQAYVEGVNLRVHTIGGEVFATAIESDATDYRYAGRDGGEPAGLRAVELSDDLADRCLQLTASLGLEFAGIDLKITPEGAVYCFEVNPSPAFSYYEGMTGQPISAAVAHRLAGVASEREEPLLALSR
jgi:hypothetical protein